MNHLPIEVQQLFEYLKAGTSAFHVIAHAKKVLAEAGFQELKLKETWNLEKGGRYFCIPFDTTLYAFTVGENCDLANGIHIGGAHTDFPGIKIKPNPEIFSHGHMQLNTEVYGGPILNTFFDRPLSLSGKVVTRGERYDKPVSHLVDFAAPVLYLPNLAIHMNREVNEKGAPIDNQKHLLPMLGMVDDALNKDTKFVDLLADKLGVDANDILDYDLCIYNLEQPELIGIKEDFIRSQRLDDITSCSALIHGLIESNNTDRVNLVCLFDNEEVGSGSKQGALSMFLADTLKRIFSSLGLTEEELMISLAKSFMVSCDNAHATHPNQPQLCDALNRVYMNEGIVVKTNANLSYTTDAISYALFTTILKENDIKFQVFANRSDVRGGSTLGHLSQEHVSIDTIDIGLAQLAMHSSNET